MIAPILTTRFSLDSLSRCNHMDTTPSEPLANKSANKQSRTRKNLSRRNQRRESFRDVHAVADLLDYAYPPTRLGNKSNPLDELAYIILSGQTNESLYQSVYTAAKRRFRSWRALLNVSEEEIAETIQVGGLGRIKARFLKSIALRLQADFGEVSLRTLKRMTNAETEKYLCSLPGVGIKTARCVLLYSLDRAVFPADIHCLRVMSRLKWISWSGERADRFADEAQAGIPEHLRFLLHVKFVQHGRAVCRAKPLCSTCVLQDLCPSSRIYQGT